MNGGGVAVCSFMEHSKILNTLCYTPDTRNFYTNDVAFY